MDAAVQPTVCTTRRELTVCPVRVLRCHSGPLPLELSVSASCPSRASQKAWCSWASAMPGAGSSPSATSGLVWLCASSPAIPRVAQPAAVGLAASQVMHRDRGHAHEGRHFAVYLFVHTKHSQKAGPFSVARLKMDLPFHNRLAYNRVHRRSACPLTRTIEIYHFEPDSLV